MAAITVLILLAFCLLAQASNLTISIDEELAIHRERRACPRIIRVEPRPYGEWSRWSSCSKTCGGGGVQHRRRQCVVADCQTSESRACGHIPCALGWSEWCEWGHCLATCGQGEKMRMRYCEAGTLRCPGKDYEISRCQASITCEGWTDWSDWTPCSVSCGLGRQRRERQCVDRQRCRGETTEEKECNQICHGDWSAWGGWSQCDRPCGGGVEQRHRVCQSTRIRCPGADRERRRCNDHSCPPQSPYRPRQPTSTRCQWTGWSRWTDCVPPQNYKCDHPQYIGVGVHQRTRQCVGNGVQCHEQHCGGSSSERQSCRLDPRRDPCYIAN